MNEKMQSQQFLRRRKFFLFAPILVIPFLTLAFYALGGGKGEQKLTPSQNGPVGLNLNLPNANLKDEKGADKLSFYEHAEKLDKERQDAIRNDPYFKLDSSTSSLKNEGTNELEMLVRNSTGKFKPSISQGKLNSSPIHGEGADPNEEKILKKLQLLERQINEPQAQTSDQAKEYNSQEEKIPNDEFNNSVDRLESMAQMINEGQSSDPEIQKLDGLLNKIIDIQHPERLKAELAERSVKNQGRLYPVEHTQMGATISTFGIDTPRKEKHSGNGSGFFGTNNMAPGKDEPKSIRAMVQGSQVLSERNEVKLRLLDDVLINGSLVPKNTPVFGIVVLTDSRLEVHINTIQHRNTIYPVQLEAYDLTGIKGLQVDGRSLSDAAKQSTINGMQLMELSSLNPSVSAQAATAGINAAKSLITRKVRPVRVTVKSRHLVLLKNKNDELKISQ